MSLLAVIIVLVLLALALIAVLSGTMALPRHLRRHRPPAGRPAPRQLRLRRSRSRDR